MEILKELCAITNSKAEMMNNPNSEKVKTRGFATRVEIH